MKINSSHQRLLPCLLIACLAWPVFYGFPKLTWVLSGSIEPTLLWKIEGQPEKYDYVTFSLAHALLGEQPKTITKQLVCMAGDQLIVQKNDYFCNGQYLGTAKHRSRTGKPLPRFAYQGVIPPGKAFAAGSHPDSFDSKYWGFLDLETMSLQRLKKLL